MGNIKWKSLKLYSIVFCLLERFQTLTHNIIKALVKKNKKKPNMPFSTRLFITASICQYRNIVWHKMHTMVTNECHKAKQIKEKPYSVVSKLKLISWKEKLDHSEKAPPMNPSVARALRKVLPSAHRQGKKRRGKKRNAGVEEVSHEFQLFPLIMPQLLSRKCICLGERKWYFSAVCSSRMEQA